MTALAGRADIVVTKRGEARFHGRRIPCAIGASGFRRDKIEGDGATPIGVFHLEYGLFRPDRVPHPGGVLDWRPILLGQGWSDDPADPCYNQPIRRPHPFSHEQLRRPDPLYDLVVVFDANRYPILRGKGSALFLHVWRRPRHPTEGCVAFSQSDLSWILKHLRPDTKLRLGC